MKRGRKETVTLTEKNLTIIKEGEGTVSIILNTLNIKQYFIWDMTGFLKYQLIGKTKFLLRQNTGDKWYEQKQIQGYGIIECNKQILKSEA